MFDVPPPDPGFEFFISSHGMSKGAGQTDGPQAIPKAWLQFGDVQVGGQWKNVTSSSAKGEASAFLNATRKLGPWQLSGGAGYKFQTGVTGNPDSRSWEFSGGATRKIGTVALRANAIFSPDDLGGTRRSLYLEGGPAFELGKTLKLSANVGHRSRVNGADYTSFNVGMTQTLWKCLAIDVRYYDTSRSTLDDIYRSRLVFSGRMSF